ncbi:hypothetical protein [Bacillus sp. 1P06AnD]|uniref:hypothetical protein n=1 Tax=Bacillus sp. 1P06AnD TaxID=3132208 RepID=UPI0039A155F5
MQTVEMIYKKYPNVKLKADNPSDPSVLLTVEESVFFQMVMFFNNPDSFQFSINILYSNLKNEELFFALKCLIEYFQKDTSLLNEIEQSIYDNELLSEKLLNQKLFSEYVESALNIKFSSSMVRVYWLRGKVPTADLIIDGTPYWKEKTVLKFIEQERIIRANKTMTPNRRR